MPGPAGARVCDLCSKTKAGEEDEQWTASPHALAGLISNHVSDRLTTAGLVSNDVSDGLAHTCAELATRQALHVT